MDINTETVSTFADIAGKYGVPILISVVVVLLFLYIIIRDRKVLKKTVSDPMETLVNNMVTSVTTLINTVIDSAAKPHHPTPSESAERDTIDLELKNVLKEALSKLEADRVYVFLYHNGGVSVSNYSFNKMSAISEAIAPGIKSIVAESQQLARGPYSEIIQAFKDNSEFFVSNVEDIKETNPSAYGWFQDRASQATYLRALKDHERQVVGFVGADYVTIHDMPTEEKIRKVLVESSSTIMSLVIVGDYQNKLSGKEITVK